MPQFRYTIHTHGGQVITDTTIAASEKDARYELENLGNTVLNITEIGEGVKRTKHQFAFEGLDATGKKLSGKIKTVDEMTARVKLEREHGLSNVVLREIEGKMDFSSEERLSIIQEAQGVLIKAGSMLSGFDARDERYLMVSSVQARLNELITNDDVEGLRTETPKLLGELQDIEQSVIEQIGQSDKEEVVMSTEQLIEQVKAEAEKLKKDPRFLYLNTVLSEGLILSRWLLVFYAAYFTFAEVTVAKRLNVPFSDFLANSLQSALLYKVTLAVLAVYLFCRIKLSLLESTFLPAIILAGVTGLLVISLFLV